MPPVASAPGMGDPIARAAPIDPGASWPILGGFPGRMKKPRLSGAFSVGAARSEFRIRDTVREHLGMEGPQLRSGPGPLAPDLALTG